MLKPILLLVVAGIVLALGVSILGQTRTEEPPKFGTKKTACQILNKDVAQKVLNVAEKSSSPSSQNASDKNNKVTHCTYISASKDLPKGSRYATSLTVYSPKTSEGIAVNKRLFDEANDKPGIMFATTDNGVRQFWNTSKGELELLNGNSRYTILVGSAKSSDRNYARALELAELLKKEF